jgi:hypothetical protein
MMFSNVPNFMVAVEKQGPCDIAKASFPLRYGKFSEVKTHDYEFTFNLNGEIKNIRGLHPNWPHPAAQLKRTDGNDWVYYTVGDQSSEHGVISWLDEYYLPCLPYPSNQIWDVKYQSDPNVMTAFGAWTQLYANLYGARNKGLAPRAKALIDHVLANDDRTLFERSRRLNDIIGERVSVLPPDTRHVDYEIIPLTIADGCLYRCDFCCVKSTQHFKPRSRDEILRQIQDLSSFYGRNLENYRALFLGNHDALAAGAELISFAASEAYEVFGFDRANASVPKLYLFGSVDSLLKLSDSGLYALNQLPFYTYINVGFESVDAPTLSFIRKPLDASKVQSAFQKMLAINEAFPNLEVTGNFLIGQQLTPEHYETLADLLRTAPKSPNGKGTVYLSPLKDSPKRRELLPRFYEIKAQSQLPVFTYLIQRL